MMGLIGEESSSSRTYATWNPSDKDSTATLSNGNLTLTTATNGKGTTRATIGKSSGKWYWEIAFSSGGSTAFTGIANSSASLIIILGGDANGWSYFGNNGQKYTNNSGAAYGDTFTTQVIGIALDMDNGKVWFSKSGIWQNSGDPAAGTNAAFTGLSGTIYPAASDGTDGGGSVSTVNFGATSLTYSPPSGFNSGLYN